MHGMLTITMAYVYAIYTSGVPHLHIVGNGRSDIDVESIALEMVKLASVGIVARRP